MNHFGQTLIVQYAEKGMKEKRNRACDIVVDDIISPCQACQDSNAQSLSSDAYFSIEDSADNRCCRQVLPQNPPCVSVGKRVCEFAAEW